MKIDHVRFYVKDAQASRDWFLQKLGFQPIVSGANEHSRIEIVHAGSIYFVLCSALTTTSPIAQFLKKHPAGVSDLAFCVQDLEATIGQAVRQGATLIQPIQTEQQANGYLKWATIAAWGDLTHTFVERSGITSLLPLTSRSHQCTHLPAQITVTLPSHLSSLHAASSLTTGSTFRRIDHVVLNVAEGDLERAVLWYKEVLGFQPQQLFEIQTEYSALCSRVMLHPLELVQLPINQPASPNSQIQEFLDVNQGPGIQHIALETTDLVSMVTNLRRNGLSLLQVPGSYYTQLQQRPGLPLSRSELQPIADQQILIDWQNEGDRAVLLQTFTQPIFDQPTFFFELIERRVSMVNGQPKQAQGFGEGNFRALFEAIEREQMKRGSLKGTA